ncbi:hypothetical protein PLCT1_01107 [Planctomycetaceae bacterium]|nr:hypothetical protein PLCT1_01107 [Planctomycetaceae bacterium]
MLLLLATLFAAPPAASQPPSRATAWALWQVTVPLDVYALEHGEFPHADLCPFRDIAPLVQPYASVPLPVQDAWGNDLLYASCGSTYLLLAVGSSGQIDLLPGGGPSDNPACSVVLVGGDPIRGAPFLWQGPQGLDIVTYSPPTPLLNVVLGSGSCQAHMPETRRRITSP